MAQSKRKRKQALRNKKDEKRIFMVIAGCTLLVIIIMYISYAM